MVTRQNEFELVRQLEDQLNQNSWSYLTEYKVKIGGRQRIADFVLFYESAILAVIEIKQNYSRREEASKQIIDLAGEIGAPLAYIWDGREFHEMRNVSGSLHPPFQFFPKPDTMLDFLGSLRSIFLSDLPECKIVRDAYDSWLGIGSTKLTGRHSSAVDFYICEYLRICPKVPLSQCVLLGAMFEGILKDVALMKGHTAASGKLDTLINQTVLAGLIEAGTGDLTPHIIRLSRNALHPDAFIKHSMVGQGISRNSALALSKAIEDLNTSL